MNKDGYINIVGRAKERIIRGGENLYPIEIENYLLEHPGVLEVAVIGLPDKKYDEECCAVARVDSTKLKNPNELREWCKERISRWKVPKYIFFIDTFNFRQHFFYIMLMWIRISIYPVFKRVLICV